MLSTLISVILAGAAASFSCTLFLKLGLRMSFKDVAERYGTTILAALVASVLGNLLTR